MKNPTRTASDPVIIPPGQQPARRRNMAAVWLLGFIFVFALAAVLKASAVVAIPIVFAVLITLIVAPLYEALHDILPKGLKWAASLCVMLILVLVLAAFVTALVFAAQQVVGAVPDLSDRIDQVLRAPAEGEGSGVLAERIRSLWNEMGGQIGGWIVERASALSTGIASMTGTFIATIVIVFFLVLLTLSEVGDWRGKAQALWPAAWDTTGRKALATIAHRLRVFLVVRTGVGLLQAALYTAWLAIFGIDLLFVWAVLTFVLTYIPNVGSVISGTLPSLYALITADLGTALAVAGGILVIEQVIGNFVDPRLLGRQILLSPVVILMSLMIWGWLWGAAGAFLATPLLLCMLVLFNTVPALRSIALMVSNQSDPERLDSLLDAGS